MKILFIESEVDSINKLIQLSSKAEIEKTTFDYPYLATMNNSLNTTEDILKELNVNGEMIEEIKKYELDNVLLIILKDKKIINEHSNHLTFDFKKTGNLKYKNFNFDLDQEEVYINDRRIILTALEYKLLLFFVTNAKKIVSRNEIIDYLWDNSSKQVTGDATLYTHIKNLKKKIIKSGIGNFIHSIYGQGYRFEDPEEILS